MADFLDTSRWHRREAFEYFKGFDKPYFNVCVRLDAAPLKAALAARGGGSFSLACYWLATRVANRHEPLRLRLEGQIPSHSALIVRWNGRRLLPEPGSDLSFLIPQDLVKGRPRWNELTLDDMPQGSQLQRILVQSTSRWWK